MTNQPKFAAVQTTFASSFALSGAIVVLLCGTAYAGPEGAQVVTGQVNIQRAGDLTTIQASNNSIINFRSFDLGRHESVNFVQPDSASRVMNRITSAAPTMIDGTITANGRVYFVNPAGVMFGPNAVVDVGQMFAAAGNLSNADFLRGIDRFTNLQGAVINQGVLRGENGVALLGGQVVNTGSIFAPKGAVMMMAGKEAYVGTRRGRIFAKVEAAGQARPEGNAAAARPVNAKYAKALNNMLATDLYGAALYNSGTIVAPDVRLESTGAGDAKVSGTIDASNDQGQGGNVRVLAERVELTGATIDASGATGGGEVLIGGNFQGKGAERRAESTFISPDTTIRADATERGDGGRVIVWSDDLTRYFGTISARGGELGGDGGFVEVSGKDNLAYRGAVGTGAPRGRRGSLLLDPKNIIIQSGGTDPINDAFATNANANYFIDPADIVSALGMSTNVTLQANNDISVLEPIIVASATPGDLTLQAGRSVFVGADITTANGNLTLIANDERAVSGQRDNLPGSSAGNVEIDTMATVRAGTGRVLMQVRPSTTAPFDPGNVALYGGIEAGTIEIDMPSTRRASQDDGNAMTPDMSSLLINGATAGNGRGLLLRNGGEFDIDLGNNRVGFIAGVNAGIVSYRDTAAASDLVVGTVNAVSGLSAGTITLVSASNSLSQTQAINATQLFATAQTAIDLSTSPNTVTRHALLTSNTNAAVSYYGIGYLRYGTDPGPNPPAGSNNIRVGSSGPLALIAGGPISQSAAINIGTNLLTARTVQNGSSANGTINLDLSGNTVGAVRFATQNSMSATIDSSIVFRESNGFDVQGIFTGPGSGSIDLTSGGAITQMDVMSATSAIVGNTLSVKTRLDGGAAITLENASNDAALLSLKTRNTADSAYAPSTISYRDASGFNLFAAATAVTGASQVKLRTGGSGGVTQVAPRDNDDGVRANEFVVRTDGGVTLDRFDFNSVNTLAMGGVSGNPTSITYYNRGLLPGEAGSRRGLQIGTVDGVNGLNALALIRLQSGGALTQTQPINTFVLDALTRNTAGAGITLNLTDGMGAPLNGVTQLALRARDDNNAADAPGAIAYRDLDGFSVGVSGVGGITTLGNVTLVGGGAIQQTQTFGAIVANTLDVLTRSNAGAGITLTNANNDASTVSLKVRNLANTDDASANIQYVDANAFAVRAATTGRGTVGNLTRISLTSGGSANITQAAPGAGEGIRGSELLLISDGDVTLDQFAANSVDFLGSSIVGALTFRNKGDLGATLDRDLTLGIASNGQPLTVVGTVDVAAGGRLLQAAPILAGQLFRGATWNAAGKDIALAHTNAPFTYTNNVGQILLETLAAPGGPTTNSAIAFGAGTSGYQVNGLRTGSASGAVTLSSNGPITQGPAGASAILANMLFVSTYSAGGEAITLNDPTNMVALLSARVRDASDSAFANAPLSYRNAGGLSLGEFGVDRTNGQTSLTTGGSVNHASGIATASTFNLNMIANSANYTVNPSNNIGSYAIDFSDPMNGMPFNPGGINFTSTDPLGVLLPNINTTGNPNAAGNVNVTAAGPITQAGFIYTNKLTATTSAGGIYLVAPSSAPSPNRVNAIQLSAGAGNVEFASDGAGAIFDGTVGVCGITAINGNVTLRGQTGTTFTQRGPGAGPIDALGLRLIGADFFFVDFATNTFGNLAGDLGRPGSSGGATVFSDGPSLQIGTVAGNIDSTSGLLGDGNWTIQSAGGVSQAAGSMRVNRLSVTGTSVNLAGADNRVSFLTLVGGPVRYADTGGFTISSITATGAARLTAGGDVTQTGDITAPSLRLDGTGSFLLADALRTNRVQILSVGTTGNAAFRNVGDLRIGTVDQSALPGSASLSGAAVGAAGTLTLRVVGGELTQTAAATGGTFVAETFDSTGKRIFLDTTGNHFGSVALRALDGETARNAVAGSITYRDDSSFDYQLADLQTTSFASLRSTGAGLTQQTGALRADGGLALSGVGRNYAFGGANTIPLLAASTAGGNVVLNTLSGLDLGTVDGVQGLQNVGLAQLSAVGAITQSQAATGNTLIAQTFNDAGSFIRLNTTGNHFTTVTLRSLTNPSPTSVPGTAAGTIVYRDDTAMDFALAGVQTSQTFSINRDVTSAAGARVTQSGAIAAGTLALTGGSYTLTDPTNSFTSLVANGTRNADLSTATALSLDGYSDDPAFSNASTLAINATGALTQTAALRVNQLTVRNAAAVTLDTVVNNAAIVTGASAGTFTYRDADSLIVDGIAATGNASFTSDSGTLTLQKTGMGANTVTRGTLTLNGASVTITGATTVATSGDFVVTATDPTTLMIPGATITVQNGVMTATSPVMVISGTNAITANAFNAVASTSFTMGGTLTAVLSSGDFAITSPTVSISGTNTITANAFRVTGLNGASATNASITDTLIVRSGDLRIDSIATTLGSTAPRTRILLTDATRAASTGQAAFGSSTTPSTISIGGETLISTGPNEEAMFMTSGVPLSGANGSIIFYGNILRASGVGANLANLILRTPWDTAGSVSAARSAFVAFAGTQIGQSGARLDSLTINKDRNPDNGNTSTYISPQVATIIAGYNGTSFVDAYSGLSIFVNNEFSMGRGDKFVTPASLTINGGAQRLGDIMARTGISLNTPGTVSFLGRPGARFRNNESNDSDTGLQVFTGGTFERLGGGATQLLAGGGTRASLAYRGTADPALLALGSGVEVLQLNDDFFNSVFTTQQRFTSRLLVAGTVGYSNAAGTSNANIAEGIAGVVDFELPEVTSEPNAISADLRELLEKLRIFVRDARDPQTQSERRLFAYRALNGSWRLYNDAPRTAKGEVAVQDILISEERLAERRLRSLVDNPFVSKALALGADGPANQAKIKGDLEKAYEAFAGDRDVKNIRGEDFRTHLQTRKGSGQATEAELNALDSLDNLGKAFRSLDQLGLNSIEASFPKNVLLENICPDAMIDAGDKYRVLYQAVLAKPEVAKPIN